MEELRSRLAESLDAQETTTSSKNGSLHPNSINCSPPPPEKPSHCVEVQSDVDKGAQSSELNASNGVIVCHIYRHLKAYLQFMLGSYSVLFDFHLRL